MNPVNAALAHNFRHLREMHGVSKTYISKMTGFKAIQVSMYEKLCQRIPFLYTMAMAELFNTPVENLFGAAGESYVRPSKQVDIMGKYQQFLKNITYLRETNNISLRLMAAHLDVLEGSYRTWEYNLRSMPSHVVPELSKVLGVYIDKLINYNVS